MFCVVLSENWKYLIILYKLYNIIITDFWCWYTGFISIVEPIDLLYRRKKAQASRGTYLESTLG